MNKKNNGSLLMLDVNQAAELKMAFRRNGWTNSDIKLLSGGDTLKEVLSFMKSNKRELLRLDEELNSSIKEECYCDLKKVKLSGGDSPDNDLMKESLLKEVQRILSKLNDDEIKIIKYYYGLSLDKNYSFKEIAEMMGLQIQVVKKHHSIAIKKIKIHLPRKIFLKEYLNF